MMTFYVGQGKSRSKSKSEFDEMFLIKGPCDIEGMFQVLSRFLWVVRYRVAFSLNKVYKLSAKGLKVKNFFNFIFSFFANSDRR